MKTGWDIRLAGWFAWAMVVIFMSMVFIGGIVVTCHGAGVSFGYAWDAPLRDWRSGGLKCSVGELEISDELRSPWYGSLVINPMQGELSSPQTIDGHSFSRWSNGVAISSRVSLRGQLVGKLYGRLFGGFGILLGHLPEIGDSGVVGHFGAEVGVKFGNVALSYSITHMSDPLQHHDFGWNYQMLSIRFSF